jgi:hypothetical protein
MLNKRRYSLDKVLKQIESIELDYNKYIKIQKDNTDIIIIILNNSFIKKIMNNNFLINYHIDDNKMIIKINENLYDKIICIIKHIIN